MMSNPLTKIIDPDLRALAESDRADAVVDVLVELNAPAAADPPRYGGLAPREVTKRKDLADPEVLDSRAAAMDRLEDALAGLGLSTPPVRFSTAQAFAVRLTPAQLRRTADFPLTGAIRPNRSHRR
jgi:hypothetical protein